MCEREREICETGVYGRDVQCEGNVCVRNEKQLFTDMKLREVCVDTSPSAASLCVCVCYITRFPHELHLVLLQTVVKKLGCAIKLLFTPTSLGYFKSWRVCFLSSVPSGEVFGADA